MSVADSRGHSNTMRVINNEQLSQEHVDPIPDTLSKVTSSSNSEALTSSLSCQSLICKNAKSTQKTYQETSESPYVPYPQNLPPLSVCTYPSQVPTMSVSLNTEAVKSFLNSTTSYGLYACFPQKPRRQVDEKSSETNDVQESLVSVVIFSSHILGDVFLINMDLSV